MTFVDIYQLLLTTQLYKIVEKTRYLPKKFFGFCFLDIAKFFCLNAFYKNPGWLFLNK